MMGKHRGEPVIVVGGGYIGTEVAAQLINNDLKASLDQKNIAHLHSSGAICVSGRALHAKAIHAADLGSVQNCVHL